MAEQISRRSFLKGKPHLKPVEDTMARANNLAAAMIVAPIAGVSAAVGKFYKRTK